MEHKRAIPQLSVDAQVLYRRLREVRAGEMVSYAELSQIIGRNIQKTARPLLYTAMKKALSDDGLVFAAVHGEGVKHLADTEIISIGEQAYPHIRKTARRAIRKLTAVKEFDRMPNEDKIKHNTLVSMLGAVAHITTNAQVIALESKVSQGLSALPLAKTLEFFRT